MRPLVSIVVVTYNSSQFVIETLESVSQQTWNDIELIITDDFSSDDTIEVCLGWLNTNNNKDRFIRTEIIKAKSNSGVPANANRGLYAAKGDWLAFLAGDDTLKPDYIRDNMTHIASRPEIKVLLSGVEVYKDTFEPQNLLRITPEDAYNQNSIVAPGRSADSQYRMLLLHDRIHYTPSLFINRETLTKVGGFDERFKLLEDYPLWLNLTRNGYKIYFMDKVTVNYRRHSKSIYNTGDTYLIEPNYFQEENFRRIYTYPNMPADIRLNERFFWYASQIFRWKWLNKNILPNRMLLSLLTLYLNPFKYFIWIRKRLNKGLNNNELYM
ncbi:MAG: glycosyltransferase [Bacteroidales bacterium]|nr:glycosyltransferase [Bacteroidales bacterium]